MEVLLAPLNKSPTPSVPPLPMPWQQDLVLRSIKIVDIGYITSIYFTIAFFLSTYIDNKLGEFNKEEADQKTTLRLFGESVLHMYLMGVLVYVIRNLIEKIPFPLNGVQGFIHTKVKELTNATVFVFIFILYQKNFRAKLDYLRERIYKKK